MNLELFIVFLKVGAFTFGGGYAMLPLIQYEVSNRGWMALSDLIDFIAISESTPGPFAVNVSTYVGSIRNGFSGALCATLGVILPSFVIILLVAKFYQQFKHSKIVAGIMSGLKPTVVGLIASSVVSVGKSVFISDGVSSNTIYSAIIFLVAFRLMQKKIHPIAIIIVSGILGVIANIL